jgi:carbohydrate kinase (thermoresistant glucokinase family)
MSERPLVVVMGVSGAGKSTVGIALADLLGVRFVDADALHPPANVAKMAAGTPLTDADRWPWLDLVATTFMDANETGLVVACSALKRAYRDRIRAAAPAVLFMHLTVPRPALDARVAGRPDHFMPASLLDSQLETLEPLEPGEAGFALDSEGGVEATARRALLEIQESTT